MSESSSFLEKCLRRLRYSARADSISLYAPPVWEGGHALFLDSGDPPLAPEIATTETAGDFDRQMAAKLEMVQLGAAAVAIPSADGRCRLIRVASDAVLTLADAAPKQILPERRVTDRHLAIRENYCVLIGLRFGSEAGAFPATPPSVPARMTLDASDELAAERSWLLAFVASLAWRSQEAASVSRDPISNLPGRPQLMAALDRSFAESRRSRSPIAMLLINPDEFDPINERFGRAAGDQVMQDVADRIRRCFRSTDYIAKYGGASFACVLTNTPSARAQAVAQKASALLAEAAFLNGAVRLGFSIGISAFGPDENPNDTPLDLIRRADQALYAAKRSGGSVSIVWQQEWAVEEAGQLDRLSGIFTGNLSKDYRNMVLLLDIGNVLAGTSDIGRLAKLVLERLCVAFKPEIAGLLALNEDSFRTLSVVLATASDAEAPVIERPPRQQLLERARRERRPVQETLDAAATTGAEESRAALAVPLLTTDECIGCLYLENRAEFLSVDSSDLMLLKALASQLALAIHRSQLADRDRQRIEAERQQLEVELKELRRSLRAADLVYRSPEMESVLAVARTVAPTDATVLITGESGTGKELLARAIHELSPRRKRPLSVVDCAAMPGTLLESELFGHERGAFTGADRRRLGRLAESDGATLLLDEIGELPLEIQAKLLRFVQEKSFTPVGGNAERTVDVRLIAATNRDLVAELAAGRFREDLYHRLNVFKLVVPPLRDRRQDILHLAEHFREVYSLRYGKSVARIAPEAEALLLQSPWPGNVRELQNSIMQAVILCAGDVLAASDLPAVAASGRGAVERSSGMVAVPAPAASRPGETATIGGWAPAGDPLAELWERLGELLASRLAAIGESEPARPEPFGKWLEEDLIVEARETAGGSRRAAALLGVPESSVRRKLRHADDQSALGTSSRSPAWSQVRALLARIVRSHVPDGSDLPARAESVLLRVLEASAHRDARFTAAILGVTEPTYQRRLARLERK